MFYGAQKLTQNKQFTSCQCIEARINFAWEPKHQSCSNWGDLVSAADPHRTDRGRHRAARRLTMEYCEITPSKKNVHDL